ncbi:monovalent cation/H(+) antiporter subunit G [Paracoccus beibuensis]|uniref:monovalent cation/H(+) antiporter subunit G n=1 Tax=Paracoccus beibuensis TaxID=547602 RepID=UPI00223FDD04|nr:monovalent cation/H(+) antiporter subunit G [Paracoccus beibuensis]
MIAELIVSFLIVAGGVFCLSAGLGVLRLPDVLTRMHASTKAGTLGSGLILIAVAVVFAEGTVIARAVAAILFLLLTAPVAAHLIGRAAFRTGVPMIKSTACEPGVAEALRGPNPPQPPR